MLPSTLPDCRFINGPMNIPTLILIGELDTRTPAGLARYRRCLREHLQGAELFTTMPVMIGPVSVFSKVKNFCSSLKSALAT